MALIQRFKQLCELLIGLRKLFFAILAIIIISMGMGVVLGIFLLNWKLGNEVISGDNLTTVFVNGFQYISVIAGGYLAANVINKWVPTWLKKK